MRTVIASILLLLVLAADRTPAVAQNSNQANSGQNVGQAEKAFKAGNELMEQRKFSEALARYKEALLILPDDPSLLFNGGLAAYSSKDYAQAADLWKRLKAVDPSDWHVRSKLIQAYQALGRLPERDAERAELFEMWKAGKNAELKQQFEYCRDQFEVGGKKVMAFEHFELKGDRALRYVFSIVNEAGDGEEFRISLGSYDLTNAIWRETRQPKPKEGERLFHLDGYFPNRHATYGMYFPEPSYDAVRSQVVQILEGKNKPISGTTFAPSEAKPETKPKP
jgi:tetratricopeptide (TPR) repeat protein